MLSIVKYLDLTLHGMPLLGQMCELYMRALTRSRPRRVPPASFAPTSKPIGVPPFTPIPWLVHPKVSAERFVSVLGNIGQRFAA